MALVIVFHASRALLPGGFVGVDVFFVISGYLITGIILRETRAQTFRLQSFYARRCRRILPALVVVLVATWLIGRVVLVDEDFENLGKHILGASTFTSNVLLWRETGYFDPAATRKPLMHLWSLGVEEQFYLVWPPLLVIAAMMAARWRESALRITALILGGSVALAVLLAPAHEEATFYLLPTRMWELSVGALLLQVEQRAHTLIVPHGTFTISPDLKAAVGVLLVGGASIWAHGGVAARLLWLIGAVIGAALIISARDAWINRRVLARDAVVLVGLISYPLYLWHWPLLSFVTLMRGQAPLFQLVMLKAAVIALALILAWMTWRWVELPVRRFAAPPATQRPRRNRMVLGLSALVLMLTGALGWRTWNRDGTVAAADAGGPLRDGEALFPGASFHRVSAADSVVLLLGDSHADHLVTGLAREARRNGFGLSHVGLPSCPGIRIQMRMWGSPSLFEQCQSLADSTLSYFVRDPAVKVVVFAVRGTLYASATDGVTTYIDTTRVPREVRMRSLREGYANAISRIEHSGKRAVIVLDVPQFNFDPVYCLNRFRPTSSLVNQCSTTRESNDLRQRDYRLVVEQLRAEHPRLIVFDPMPLFCDSRRCYSKRDGHLMFRDRNHVSERGSRLIAESLATILFPR